MWVPRGTYKSFRPFSLWTFSTDNMKCKKPLTRIPGTLSMEKRQLLWNISLDFSCFWLPEYAAGYIIVKQNALLSSVALMNQSTRIRQSCDFFLPFLTDWGKYCNIPFKPTSSRERAGQMDHFQNKRRWKQRTLSGWMALSCHNPIDFSNSFDNWRNCNKICIVVSSIGSDSCGR